VEASGPLQGLRRDFALEEGGQQHFFTWTGPADSHLVVRPDSRVVASFPAQNTGVALFLGPGSRVAAVEPPRALALARGQGIEVVLRAETPRLVLEDVVLDSVRTIRDRLLGPQGSEAVRADRERFASRVSAPADWARETAELKKDNQGSRLVFHRTELNGQPYQAELSLPEGVRARPEGHSWVLEGPAGFQVRLRASVPYGPLPGYRPGDLFTEATGRLLEDLDRAGDPRAERCRASLRNLLFLARKDKLMAGSWRFLTYFGRDTMLSLLLLQPLLRPEALAAGVQSVLDRLSPDGQVAHEEDLGPWAERRRIAEILRAQETRTLGASLPGPPAAVAPALAQALQTPLYDYKMVDDDFLLPLCLHRLLGEGDRFREFLARVGPDGRKNLDKVLKNWSFVLKSAEPLARARAAGEPAESLFRHQVHLREGEHTGDWRDSDNGLGWGRYPGSVNVELVAAALRAIQAMAAALPPEEVEEAARRLGHPDLPGRLGQAGRLAEAWDTTVDAYRVHLSPEQVRERLRRYLASPALSPQEVAFYRSRPLGPGGPTLGEFLDGGPVPPALARGLRFTALSLDAQGRPVQVLNSDASFRLFLGQPSEEDLQDILTVLELEYPVGLLTPVGPVVANPAYSPDPVHHRELGRTAYHGAVVWGFQSAMLQAGLVRQLERFAHRPELAGRIRAVLEKLARAEENAGPLAASELWTHKVEDGRWQAVAFGQDGADQTESNPAQLWSTVYPAVLLDLQKAGVAGP
jgi:glycogen debranching enzyme